MKAIVWFTVALIATAITAAIFVCSRLQREPESNIRLRDIIWIYAGTFTALSIAWGFFDIMQSGGYGDGYIF